MQLSSVKGEEEEARPRLSVYVFDGTMEKTTGLDLRIFEMTMGNKSSTYNTKRKLTCL